MTRPVAAPPEWTDSNHPTTTGVSIPGQPSPGQPSPGQPAAGPNSTSGGPRVSRVVWLEAALTAPHEARDLMKALAIEWGLTDDALDDAVSIASELVTNAVVHARSRLQLSIELDPSQLTVRVVDSFPRRLHAVGDAARNDTPEHGVGLWIVDHLADSWGTVNTRDGKAVWASLAFPRH